ncbi:MAG: ABC transporter permease [Bryobacteraceae bacterium]
MSKRSFADHALVQLTLMRMREFIREPEALFWSMIFPIALAAGLGIAFRNRPPEVLKVAAVTPRLAEALRQEKLLDVTQLPPQLAEEFVRTGKVALVAEPAADGGANGSIVYRYDVTNPEGRQAKMLADQAIQRAFGRKDAIPDSDRIMSEPGSRYIDFLIPGLIGMGIMGNSIWGPGFSIVDARRKKLLKRIVATPMPKHYYLQSFLLWRMILLPVDVGVPLGFGVLVFGIPLRGPFIALVGTCVLGTLAFSAGGLLIASRVRTIEAASGLMNMTMVPMWILSGVFFSSQRFPDLVQPMIKALPLTAVIDALRANMLQGAGLAQMAPQAAVLGAWLVVCFGLALRLFRWR